jgi:hypothetical protein
MVTSATRETQLLVRPAVLSCRADCLAADELAWKEFEKQESGKGAKGQIRFG